MKPQSYLFGKGGDGILLCLFALLLAQSVWLDFTTFLFADKEWLLLCARMWLEGKRLYVDIFQPNGPLVIWIDALAIRLADASGLSERQALGVIGWLFALLSAHLCVAVAATSMTLEKRARFLIFFALLVLFGVCTGLGDFFDRDHLFFMLTLPYLAACAPGALREQVSTSSRLLIGLLASIGFCIKLPHCFIVLAGVQLVLLWRERSLRRLFFTENYVIAFCSLAYTALVLVLTPEYMHIVVPMALSTYRAGGEPWLEIVKNTALLGGIAMSVATLYLLRPPAGHARLLRYGLAVALCYIAYAIISNGWFYSYNPAAMLLLAFGALLAVRQYREGGVTAARFGVLNLLVWCSLYVAYGYGYKNCEEEGSAYCSSVDAMAKDVQEKGATSFGSISIDFATWTKIAQRTGASWDTRFNNLWMLPKFFLSDKAFEQKHAWILDYIGDAFAEDLNTHKPGLVFVDDTEQFYRVHHEADLVALFSTHGHFMEAWSHYRLLRRHDFCKSHLMADGSLRKEKANCAFFVYERMPESK